SSGFFTVIGGDDGQVRLQQIETILSSAHLGPPHGKALLELAEPPTLPQIPVPPSSEPGAWDWALKQLDRVKQQLQEKRLAFDTIASRDKEMVRALAHGYQNAEPRFIQFLASLSLVRHYLPKALIRPSETHYDASSRVILADIEIPDFASLSIVKKRGKSYELTPVSAAERKKAQ